jgi:hypothetical protein
MALLVDLALGAAIIIAVLVLVIFAAVVLLEQLAVTPDPSEAHAGDATEGNGGIRECERQQSSGAARQVMNGQEVGSYPSISGARHLSIGRHSRRCGLFRATRMSSPF